MSAVHATANLSELGRALDQASITNAARAAENNDMSSDGNVRSPKKRGRTDSLKRMLPAPDSQRPRGANSARPSLAEENNQTDGPTSSSDGQMKLMMKDRARHGMGQPSSHSIQSAVQQAPPAKEKSNPRRWSKQEDESLRLAVERSGERNWKAIADQVPGRNHTQCLQRWTKVLKPGLIKGHWTPEEDEKLRELVAEGKKNWGQVASLIPGRTSKQCRERWCNHLDPNINKGTYTEDEDRIIIEMQAKLGNRWSIIAQQLKGRTEDAVKIRWKSLMRGRKAASKDDKSPSASPVTQPLHQKPKPKSRARTRTSPPAQEPSFSHLKLEPPSNDLSSTSKPEFNLYNLQTNPHASLSYNVNYADLSVPSPTYFMQNYGPNMTINLSSVGVPTPTGSSAQHSFTPVTPFSSDAVVPTRPSVPAPSPIGRPLNTPREEWGSSQTPRSQMIMTEGHASAFELFHQQRVRLIMQEREKQGLSVSPAPSPGQALLTRELEENKERQNSIMEKGWRSAVEAMVAFNETPTSEDPQRYENMLEKGFPALYESEELLAEVEEGGTGATPRESEEEEKAAPDSADTAVDL